MDWVWVVRNHDGIVEIFKQEHEQEAREFAKSRNHRGFGDVDGYIHEVAKYILK